MRNIQVGGTSLSFDGVDDYVLVENTGGGDVSQLNFIVEFSINEYTDSTYQYLLALNSATYFNIRNNNGTLFMSLRLNGSQETFSTGYPIKLHKVYRLRVNYTGSSIEVYDLDVDETSPVYSSEASGVLSIDSDIHVGSYVNKGSILSGRIHQITVDGIFDYRMNEGEGNTVIDNSENNNDGTIYGAKWVLPKSVDEVTVWDGSRQRKVIGKIMTEDGLRDFYRPINFETDFIDTQNMALQTASTLTSEAIIVRENLFVRENIKNLAVGGTVADGEILESSNYRGYYIPVKEGEIYSIERDALLNNRFDYGFTVEEPEPGVHVEGGSTKYRNDLTIEGITIPSGYNWMFLYLSNQGDEIPNIEIIREELAGTGNVIPVRNTTGFKLGQKVTITDGINNENVKVVGRNLIINSSSGFVNPWGSWDSSTVKNVASSVLGVNTTVIRIGNRTNRDGSYQNAIHLAVRGLEIGEDYTLSCLARLSDDSTKDTGTISLYINSYESINVNRNWKLIQTTNKVSTSSNTLHIRVNFDQLSQDLYEIAFLKLEKGKKATEWSPAPEDLYVDPYNTLSVSEIKNNYPRNSIVARSTGRVDGAFSFGTRNTYTIEEV